MNIQLSADEFIFKAKDILETGDSMWIAYDIDHDQIRMSQGVDGFPVSFLSPVLCAMTSTDYEDMKRKLCELMPEAVSAIGRYW